MTRPAARAPRGDLGRTWTVAALVAVALAGWAAIAATPDGFRVASWWPAAGIAVALVALSPLRQAPALGAGIAVATCVANLVGGRELEVAAWFAATNGVAGVVGGLVLKRFRDRVPALTTPDDLLRLALAAFAAGAIVAVGAGAAVRVVLGGEVVETSPLVLCSHAAAILALTPIALARRRGPRQGSDAEAWLQGAVMAVVTVGVFASDQSLALTFAPLPLLVWAALRFSVRMVATELALFALVSTTLTGCGRGPFGQAYAEGDFGPIAAAALTQGYLVCAVVLTLPLAVAIQQRHALLARVSADEELFRRNFTESLVGMLLLGVEGDRLAVVELNDRAVRTLGGDRDALLGRHLDELVAPREPLGPVVQDLVDRRRDGWSAPCSVPGRPGARVEVAVALLSGTGEDAVLSAQVLDVTAEHRTRQRLETAEKLTSATLDTAACIILVTDTEGRIVRVNGATTAITGHEEKDLLGRHVWDTPVSPSATNDIEALFVWPNRSGQPVIRERDLVTRDGRRLRVVWNNNVVRDEDGHATYAVMTGIDVTTERTSAGLVTHLMEASISTALVGVDTRGRITVFNSGAGHLLGADPHDMVGRAFADLLDPAQLRERTGTEDAERSFAALVRAVGADGESGARDWTWVSRGGQRRVVSMTVSATEDAFGEHVGYLVVGRDVTEQRASQELLVAALEKERHAVERLQALDDAKNEFVSTVSHELRTPVTSVVGYTEMLQDGSLVEPVPAQLPLLDSIARNGQRLIALCDDLLALSGLDAGTTQWRREEVDLAAVLPAVEESVRPLVAGRRLDVAWDAPSGPVPVTGDRAQLERVLLNLVGNAVKFTEDGGSVTCRVRREGGEAVLEVADTGIGIPSAEQDGLFQKFFRSTTAQKRAIQGTGLGLSIVAAIVAAHGGRIAVDSEHLAGTTFTVHLPLAA
ncbi:PAS domain S-box protein [Nocardioides sp. SOB77]|uniref:histidine kinase n=1 Tax=Nocardioides oceani TaxID=3058369 RepID=A0ABT8FIB3_9ACTN|nr:PAS domain S-box protein [Nocardioides oceani]MDN4174439.1 PAS domain S-box protein [Nocardioides oceani]